MTARLSEVTALNEHQAAKLYRNSQEIEASARLRGGPSGSEGAAWGADEGVPGRGGGGSCDWAAGDWVPGTHAQRGSRVEALRAQIKCLQEERQAPSESATGELEAPGTRRGRVPMRRASKMRPRWDTPAPPSHAVVRLSDASRFRKVTRRTSGSKTPILICMSAKFPPVLILMRFCQKHSRRIPEGSWKRTAQG